MAKLYVPETEDIRNVYLENSGEYRDVAEGFFDRWLRKTKSEAWYEGHKECYCEEYTEQCVNPYEDEL